MIATTNEFYYSGYTGNSSNSTLTHEMLVRAGNMLTGDYLNNERGSDMFEFKAMFIGNEVVKENYNSNKFTFTKNKIYNFEESCKKRDTFEEGFLILDDKQNNGYVDLKHFRVMDNAVAREIARRRGILARG